MFFKKELEYPKDMWIKNIYKIFRIDEKTEPKIVRKEKRKQTVFRGYPLYHTVSQEILLLLNILLVFQSIYIVLCLSNIVLHVLLTIICFLHLSVFPVIPPNSKHLSNIQTIHIQILVYNMTTIIILLSYYIKFSGSTNNILIEGDSRSMTQPFSFLTEHIWKN